MGQSTHYLVSLATFVVVQAHWSVVIGTAATRLIVWITYHRVDISLLRKELSLTRGVPLHNLLISASILTSTRRCDTCREFASRLILVDFTASFRNRLENVLLIGPSVLSELSVGRHGTI